MKHFGAALLVTVGVIATLFGLLFLVGASGRPSRWAIGGVSLALGAAVVGFGVRLFKEAQSETPDRIGAEIMALAKREDGELSTDDIRALLGERFALAIPVLAQMRDAGICRQRDEGGTAFYLFPDLQPRLALRRCEFCQAELPLGTGLSTCPQCGGLVTTQVARLAVSDAEYYGIDD